MIPFIVFLTCMFAVFGAYLVATRNSEAKRRRLQQRLSDAREAWLHALELDPSNHKLMDRFREQGMGDPAQEERIQKAKRRVAGQKATFPIAQ